MKNIMRTFSIGALAFILAIIAATASLAAPPATSASYMITAQVMDTGGGTAESPSYGMLGKLRDRQIPILTSASHVLGEGFLRSVFYGSVLPRSILNVTPPFGYNDEVVNITIHGVNFQTGTTSVELRLAGQPNIVATNVVYVTSTIETCTVNLQGAEPGSWDVYMDNDGYPMTLLNGFHIYGVPLKIIGPVYNFPNPFNPDRETTLIRYTLTANADIVINLYNISGQKILSIRCASGTQGGSIGINNVPWIGRNVFESRVPNGVYLCQIMTRDGKTLATTKIAVLR